MGLKKDGTVVAVGDNTCGQCNVSDLSNIIAIAASDNCTVALTKSGCVFARGHMTDRRCSILRTKYRPAGWSGITAIAVGQNHTVGLKKDGTVIVAGDSEHVRAKVSGWSDIIAIAAGYDPLGLKRDGTIVTPNGNYYLTFKECLILESLKSKKTIAFDLPNFSLPVRLKANEFLKNETNKGMSGTIEDVVEFISGFFEDKKETLMKLRDDGTVTITGGNSRLQEAIKNSRDWNNIIALGRWNDDFFGLRLDGTVVSTSGSHYNQEDWKNNKYREN